jgi:hypothetical protein
MLFGHDPLVVLPEPCPYCDPHAMDETRHMDIMVFGEHCCTLECNTCGRIEQRDPCVLWGKYRATGLLDKLPMPGPTPT